VCGSLKGMPFDRVCGVCAPPIGGTPLTQAVPRFPSRALRWVDVEKGGGYGAGEGHCAVRLYYCSRMAQKGTGDYRYRRLRAAFLADNPVCAWCGHAPASTVDHLVPIDMGGDRNDVSRWVPACRSCNSRRGAQYGNAKRREAAAQAEHTAAMAAAEHSAQIERRRTAKPCIGWSR